MSVENIQVEILNELGETHSLDVNDLLTRALRAAAQHEEIEAGEVVVTLVDDARIQELNRTYRDKDTSTDVLSFPMQDEDDPEIYFDTEEEAAELNRVDMLGDIIISVPTAQRQAEEYGHSLEREIAFLAVHGFLHLIGYDHMSEEEEKEMFGRQETILAEMGLTRG